MSGDAVQALARAAAQTTWHDLPEAVRDQSVDLFMDALAVIAAGLGHPTYEGFVSALSAERGCASVPGLPNGVPVASAIQINGGATTVLQLQDGHRMGRGHPASHMTPALLALAEETGADAKSVLSAFIAGYEVGARIGISLGGLNPALHDTGTWTTIGTAVAAVHLLTGGKDEAAMASVIEASAAVALMPYRDLPVAGATAHHLYIGIGATTALVAARGAVAGLTPLPGTLEAFFGPRTGAAFDAALLVNDIGPEGNWSLFQIEEAYLKVHPTCAHLHGANDAVLALIQDHGLTEDTVERIEVATYAAGLAFDNPAPANDLAARFSVAATTAVAVCFGTLDEATLTEKTLHGPKVQAMIKRIQVVHDPALDVDYPAGRPTRLTVTCTDGRTLTETAVYPLGDHTNPVSRKDLRAKAKRLLNVRFEGDDADSVLSAFDAYVDCGAIKPLSAALRAPAKIV